MPASSAGCIGVPMLGLDTPDRIDHTNHHLFHATRAEAVRRAGRRDEAIVAPGRAIELTGNASERRHLEREPMRSADGHPRIAAIRDRRQATAVTM